MSVSESTGASANPSSADSVAAPSAPLFPLKDDELLTLSVDDLVAACEIAPQVNELGLRVKRISENAVVKFSEFVCLSEARNMQFVAANTSIRVPRVIRSFQVANTEYTTTTYIIMEYVRGEVLQRSWDSMSEPRRQKICDLVVNVIAELQSLRVEQVGPIGGGVTTGFWFYMYKDVQFHSVRELEDWHTHKLDICKKFERVPADTPSFTGTFGKLAMCHMDISPRNITILEGDDAICLLDWELAGMYPAHFERAALRRQKDFRDFTARLLDRIEPYEREIKHLSTIVFATIHGIGNLTWPPKQ